MAVRMELSRILVREDAEAHVVELREVNGDRIVPIIIGQNEVAAIERRLLDQMPPRPMTHELLGNVIDALGASLEQVLINDLQDQTFFARLVLKQGDQTIHIDCRPSDALALAAGGGASGKAMPGGKVGAAGGALGEVGGLGGLGGVGGVPIYVDERVIEQASISQSSSSDNSLDPDFPPLDSSSEPDAPPYPPDEE